MTQFEVYKKVFKTNKRNYGFSRSFFPPDNPTALDCLSTQWNLQEVKSVGLEDRCTFHEFAIQNLQSRLNFNITRVYKGLETDPQKWIWGDYADGFILMNQFILEIPMNEINSAAYMEENKFTALYCNFETYSSNKIRLSEWFAPFQISVWIMVLLSLLLATVILATFNRTRLGLSGYILLGSLLRQNQAVPKNWSGKLGIALGLLVCFEFSGLLLTWIYENIVIAELIVPPKIKVINDLVDLIDAGYKVEYIAQRGNDAAEMVFSLPFSLRNVAHKFKFSQDFVPLYDTNFKFDRFGHAENKTGFFISGMSYFIQNALKKMKIETGNQNCYSLKTPVYNAFSMAHVFVAQQEQLIKMVGRFREVGLLRFWYDLADHLMTLVIETSQFKRKEENLDLIMASNLASLFIFWGAVLGFTFVVVFLCFERNQHKTTKVVQISK
jgi:hypothetical protein